MHEPQIICTVCGENDFELKAGFYYCKECGTKSTEVRAIEFEDDDEYINKPKKVITIKKLEANKPELTSWECYNYILRGIVEELIDLGAKDQLKTMVLQVWAAYLRNKEVAFFSRKHELPKLGARFEKRDAKILYNQEIKRKKTKQQQITDPTTKKGWRKQMKKFDQSQYEASMLSQSQSSIGDTSYNSSSSAPSNRPIQLRFSKVALKLLKKRMPKAHRKKHEKDFDQTLKCHKLSLKFNELNFSELNTSLHIRQLYAIIAVSLNLIEDDIQLSDMIRFIDEGHITTRDFEHFFPENISDNCKETLAAFRFHRKPTTLSATTLRRQCDILCKHVHISSLKTPNIHNLAKRYITELYLPNEMYTFVERLINLHPPKLEYIDSDVTPSYESRAMAYIIFTLKLLFGLDGRKERIISTSVRKINAQMKQIGMQNIDELFVFDDWVEFIEMRKVIVCNNNVAICKQFKEVPTRSSYLQHLRQKLKVEEFNLCKEHIKKHQNMETVFSHFLQKKPEAKLTKPEVSNAIKFSASLTPCHSYFKRLRLDPVINAQIPEFMNIDHSKRNLLSLLHPKGIQTKFAEYGIKLGIRRVSCTSRNERVGIFRNDYRKLRNLENPRKVKLPKYDKEWESKIEEIKRDDGIFKSDLDQYCKKALKYIQKKPIEMENQSLLNLNNDLTPTIDLNHSIDIFNDDDMEPADFNITTPRRDLDSVDLLADLSDDALDEEDLEISHEESFIEDEGQKTYNLKISNLDYWILLGRASELTEVQTVELKSKLPATFFWLLETCANTMSVDWIELYEQVLVVETFFAYVIQPLDDFKDRIIFKGENTVKDINKILRSLKSLW